MSEKSSSQTATPVAPAKPAEKPKKRPPKQMPPFHVVLLNDDDHSYEYVIEMLNNDKPRCSLSPRLRIHRAPMVATAASCLTSAGATTGTGNRAVLTRWASINTASQPLEAMSALIACTRSL